MDRGLTDKVALITGGGSGIGRATALRLASEGARVFIIGRRADVLESVVAEVTAAGGSASCLSVDLAAADCGEKAVGGAVAWGSRLDILVNAAGTFPFTPVHELTDKDWDEAIAINLSGVMRTCRAAAHAMGEEGGAIVNVSSTNAVMGDKVSCCSAYAAAKAGQLGLTRQFAAELGPAIRVNAILPGPIDTPMLEGWLDDPAERAAWMERYIPRGRLGLPEEVAATVAFLVSDDGGYITGVTIPVDGGMTLV
ncbi:MAG: SDR family oxidoreductase [Rhodospirillaceae bacterium]|jgi:meso-butanediol dehydrogenase / (S,S)-butanediol dehydrogenase / diacetyl reductase|nr:SDR family oxidoreductase [Rhodospirillaceae bacterium]MBT6204029.1 SDR family oxidoreductase [Rhodospirillaceae bacterium]MBT6511071.1 SDR family oxidoreductase [Rhodospirillaceae bacterium]